MERCRLPMYTVPYMAAIHQGVSQEVGEGVIGKKWWGRLPRLQRVIVERLDVRR